MSFNISNLTWPLTKWLSRVRERKQRRIQTVLFGRRNAKQTAGAIFFLFPRYFKCLSRLFQERLGKVHSLRIWFSVNELLYITGKTVASLVCLHIRERSCFFFVNSVFFTARHRKFLNRKNVFYLLVFGKLLLKNIKAILWHYNTKNDFLHV